MNQKEKLVARIILSEKPWEEMKKIRKEKGMSQKELAQKMRITSSVLSDYESGRRKNPGVFFIKRFVENLL